MVNSTAPVRLHVHGRGDRSLDGILQLIELASTDSPLEEILGRMCGELALIAAVDVVSVYVREPSPDDDLLTMRGNVGFPREAIGTVRLRIGEGITGFAAECLRPVSAERAGSDSHYKHVPGLGEEHFPVFLAVPLLRGAGAAGVLVLQRRVAEPFTAAETALATALAAPVAFAIEQAQQRARARSTGERRRSARLRGVPVVGGAAMGRVSIVPTLESLRDARTTTGGPSDVALAGALRRLESDFGKAQRRLAGNRDPEVERALSNLGLALQDQRFRGRLSAGVEGDLIERLAGVARDYARVPYMVKSRDTSLELSMEERARDIEDLCVLLYAAATRQELLRTAEVWVAQHVGAFVALAAVARRASAIVVDCEVEPGCPGALIARAGGVPILSQVHGLFAWARQSDLLLVDADGGRVTANPSAAQVARHRRRR